MYAPVSSHTVSIPAVFASCVTILHMFCLSFSFCVPSPFCVTTNTFLQLFPVIGYRDPPAGVVVAEGQHYNPYFGE
jgi:hypothetical protein